MTAEEALNRQQREFQSCRYRILALEKENEALKAGTYEDPEKIRQQKQIRKLTGELQSVQKKLEKAEEQRSRQSSANLKLSAENKALREENSRLQKENAKHAGMCDRLQEALEDRRKRVSKPTEEVREKGKMIAALREEAARLAARLNTDSTNSGIPAARTPLNKKKRIPNSRVKSERPRGGQPGHGKHTMPKILPGEETDFETHELSSCPSCGGPLIMIGSRAKYETDFRVKIVKVKHMFPDYKCTCCGRRARVSVPNTLKEDNQYGTNLQAASLSLINTGFVSMARTGSLLAGLMGDRFSPCEGYISSLQRKYGKALIPFSKELRENLLQTGLLYWDDTVISVNASKACLRFYGTERLALYTAHMTKGLNGVLHDNILPSLSGETIVMHDHCKMNYNPDFHFQNIECNQHLLRDLEKLFQESKHPWTRRVKALISETIHRRNVLLLDGGDAFPDDELKHFHEVLELALEDAHRQYKDNRYFSHEEKAVLQRFQKYRNNYFRWVSDFSLPVTNNLSE